MEDTQDTLANRAYNKILKCYASCKTREHFIAVNVIILNSIDCYNFSEMQLQFLARLILGLKFQIA